MIFSLVVDLVVWAVAVVVGGAGWGERGMPQTGLVWQRTTAMQELGWMEEGGSDGEASENRCQD